MSDTLATAKTATADFLLGVVTEVLSDGSIAHNVRFGNFVFHAISEEHANNLAAEIADAINEHCTDDAEIIAW